MRKMKRQQYLMASAALFGFGALVHLLRLLSGWSLVLGGWEAPMWVSMVAVIVAGYLAYQGYTLSQKK